jgi:predicted Rossmann fold nucleotide-binding protein DprA/Smf involved in DNA uptake
MKFRISVLASVFLTTLAIGGQTRPPENGKANNPWNPLDNPPQTQQTAKPHPENLAHLQQDAQELARLAQLIPGEIHQVESGLLPKDLDGQLRQIAKLSKQLRHEISR